VIVHNGVLQIDRGRAELAACAAPAEVVHGPDIVEVDPRAGLQAAAPRFACQYRRTKVVHEPAAHAPTIRVVTLPADARVARLRPPLHLGAVTAADEILLAHHDQLVVVDERVLDLPDDGASLAAGTAEAQMARLVAMCEVDTGTVLKAAAAELGGEHGLQQLIVAAATHTQEVGEELLA